MTVLDASAVLALLLDEPGADAVLAAVDGATLSAVNLAEVLAKLSDRAQPVDDLPEDLAAAGIRLEPFGPADAGRSAALLRLDQGRTLSLGDRCCLALGWRLDRPVLTADRAWLELDLPVQVVAVR